MTKTDDLRTRALAGPWRAVITDEDHVVIDEEELVDLEGDVTVSVVRDSGLPVRQDDDEDGDEPVEQLPNIRSGEDCAFEDGCFDDARSALFVWHQAQAMAAGLNAASAALTPTEALPAPVDQHGEWRRYAFGVAVSPSETTPYRFDVEIDGAETRYAQTTEQVEAVVRAYAELAALGSAPADADATADQPQPDREDQADEPKCSECGEPDPLNTHILGCEATCEHGVPMTVECEPCKS